MAETKTSISELTAATSVGSDDLLFVSQLSGSTWNSKKATVGQLPFLKTTGSDQQISACSAFTFKGTTDWTSSSASDVVHNAIYLKDANDLPLVDLRAVKSAAGHYSARLRLQAPVGEGGANVGNTLTLYVTSTGQTYVGMATPPDNSNEAIGATTEWVRSTIQSTAFYTLNTLGSGTSLTLADHAINAKTLVGNTTFILPSANADNVARDFAVYIAVPATQYSVTFAVPSGETMTFKGDGFTAWPILDASSYYIFTFTELNSSGTFLVGYKKLSNIS